MQKEEAKKWRKKNKGAAKAKTAKAVAVATAELTDMDITTVASPARPTRLTAPTAAAPRPGPSTVATLKKPLAAKPKDAQAKKKKPVGRPPAAVRPATAARPVVAVWPVASVPAVAPRSAVLQPPVMSPATPPESTPW